LARGGQTLDVRHSPDETENVLAGRERTDGGGNRAGLRSVDVKKG
jgi:hypothetical protein